MTVTVPEADVVADIEATELADPTSAGVTANWPARAGAFAVDVFFGAGVVLTALLVAWAAPLRGWLWWVAVVLAGVVFLAMALNRLLLPSITGWTLGRSLAGIVVVRRDGAPVGPWRLLLRDIAHLIDTAAVFLGWLWPLWDPRRRTFADLIVGTEVRRVEGERPRRRRLVGAVLVALAVLAGAATGAGYLAVYRPALADEQAREQLAVQGPQTVAQMLSYKLATADDDFTRARGLVTDGYRQTLVADQDRARKLRLADTEYWVTDSAVLTSTRDRGEMLIFMQGQRGEAPNLRLISATVQVRFERSGNGQWKVADFSVLARPTAGEPK
ncbi:RDD family protein [Mycolicibacterium sp. Dal123E01]|uniref:RDD family protein n=1 Tax=Mycolicibacterium sp. Dal123E01 TaxID=3457578 RepID=UPI00403E8C5F